MEPSISSMPQECSFAIVFPMPPRKELHSRWLCDLEDRARLHYARIFWKIFRSFRNFGARSGMKPEAVMFPALPNSP